jgi:bifunctional DNA-binding transcriptional regulator/antitoxin component of YhaV-PrlF toxin-antitoxin module
MRITSRGQVTIPVKVREQAGLFPRTEVDFEFDGKTVRIVRARTRKDGSRGSQLIAHLRGRGDVAMSTDAIMALTRQRVSESRVGGLCVPRKDQSRRDG